MPLPISRESFVFGWHLLGPAVLFGVVGWAACGPLNNRYPPMGSILY